MLGVADRRRGAGPAEPAGLRGDADPASLGLQERYLPCRSESRKGLDPCAEGPGYLPPEAEGGQKSVERAGAKPALKASRRLPKYTRMRGFTLRPRTSEEA